MCTTCPHLRRLDLDGNFGGEHAAYVLLTQAMKRCTQLQHFDLIGGSLGVQALTKPINALGRREFV